MAKAKGKGSKTSSVPQRHIHSRLSFLYQAATLLSGIQMTDQTATIPSIHGHQRHQATDDQRAKHSHTPAHIQNLEEADAALRKQEPGGSSQRDAPQGLSMAHAPMARRLLSHLRGVSLKSQIRLSPAMKHSVCKRCDTLLVPGSTSTSRIENLSRGGKKPWADVMVICCGVCYAEKRFPVGARRQQKRKQRRQDAVEQPEVNDADVAGD
ncbi:RNAse P, Rpr2/Rpp21 subunit [Lasallia pustulata]|uniref:RNAse P, Rpr2/Rpp21 subunit n=1 Tax=Lasallia pustulata TaxID=136370 RepID=A0A1W5DBI3_9LECA|nr:RNAse P, Rpr2/Rpp21 subunit [Lasallia pustulata]